MKADLTAIFMMVPKTITHAALVAAQNANERVRVSDLSERFLKSKPTFSTSSTKVLQQVGEELEDSDERSYSSYHHTK